MRGIFTGSSHLTWSKMTPSGPAETMIQSLEIISDSVRQIDAADRFDGRSEQCPRR